MNSLLAPDRKTIGMSINDPKFKHAAIQQCCNAWNVRYQAERATGRGIVSCACRANEAYRTAMPPLTTAENIGDFVACVTYGTMIGTICHLAATQLLYAAQVATGLQNHLWRVKNKNPPKSKKKEMLRKKDTKAATLSHAA